MIKERFIMENPPNNSNPPSGSESPPERGGLSGLLGRFRSSLDSEPGPPPPTPPAQPEQPPSQPPIQPPEAPTAASPEEPEEPEIRLPVVGVTPSEWWHPDLGDWEKVDRDPNERMIKGAARAILHFDQTVRYEDRNGSVYKDGYVRYEAALRDFEKFSEQSRLYHRNAQIVEMVKQFRNEEEEVLKGVLDTNREEVRLKIYERDRLNRELDHLREHNVGSNFERHGLYSKEQWDRAIEKKEVLEDRVPQLEGEINAEIDPHYLGRRDDQRVEIAEAIKLANAEREAEEEKKRRLEDETDWEKQLGLPEMPSGYTNFLDIVRTRGKQAMLKNKATLKVQRDRAREKEIRKEIARGRDPHTIDIEEIDGLPAEIIDQLQELDIDLDDTEEYDENALIEANKAADRILFEREQIGAFDNLIQPLITEYVTVAEVIYERPDQFLDIDFIRRAEQIASAQSIGPYAGERGEYVRRAFRNIQKLIDEVVTGKRTEVNNFELTPGLNWQEIRETLVEGKKWYRQSEFGTFTFNDQSATTLRIGVTQFRYDITHGSNYYDQQQMLGDMQAFTKALRIINIERLARKEGWTLDQAIRFRDSLRHEGENGIAFTLMKFWGDAFMMPQMNGFYSDYWAKEGPGRLEDLLKEHDGYFSLATHLLHTKYKMIYNLEGFREGLLGKTQVQGNLMEVYKKLMVEEMMEWELKGITEEVRRERLESLRLKKIAGEQLGSAEEKELRELELEDNRNREKSREALTTCQSEDEIIDRFQKRQGNLRENLNNAEKEYISIRDALEPRVIFRDGKYVILRVAGGDEVFSAEEQDSEIKNLQQLRKKYIASKQRYDKLEKVVKEGLDKALQVDHAFGQAYELGPRKVRMENGDLLSIRDIDKILRYAATEDEDAQEAFKAKYGFKDNLALQRKRAVEWNGRFAEYAAIVKFWKFLDDLNNRQKGRENLNEKQKKWVEFYKSVGTSWEEEFKRLQDEDELKKEMKSDKINVSEKTTPYQRILQMVPLQAIESFVLLDVTTDENNPNATIKGKHFDLAKGYEYTGYTSEQLPFTQRAWIELNRNGDNAVIGGKKFRDIKDMDELEDIESFFLGRYMGTREGQDSEDAIEGSLTGELPWLNKNRLRLARTDRRGFVGSEHLTGTPQQRNNQYIAAISDTVYCDRVDGIMAYQFATTDSQGRFTPDKMTQGVPWNGTWGGNVEMDYPGYGITNIKKVIGRFPRILRGAPIREPSLARYIGFDGLHEAVGNKMFNPTDPWVFETWGKVKDAGQKFQAGYATSFNQDLGVEYRMSDKLIDDADTFRVTEHHLLSQWGGGSVPRLIARILLKKTVLVGSQEEEAVQAGIERYRRIILTFGPLAASYQSFRGAEDSRLGLEMSDLYHNSQILPVLLSEGEGPERWQEGGLDAYDAIVEMLALLTCPKGWNGEDNVIGHEYRKIRAGRDSGDPKSPVLVRTN